MSIVSELIHINADGSIKNEYNKKILMSDPYFIGASNSDCRLCINVDPNYQILLDQTTVEANDKDKIDISIESFKQDVNTKSEYEICFKIHDKDGDPSSIEDQAVELLINLHFTGPGMGCLIN